MKFKVFIDGSEGTTGLQLRQRLEKRDDIELLKIDEELRKDEKARSELMNAADIVFLCLPDAAARDAVKLVTNPKTRIIDASTAHRTADGWVYGFPEMGQEQRAAIASASRIANPGCHATGFIAAVYPLVKLGILPKDYPICCESITGYSGGGKKMIAQYEAAVRAKALDSPRQYALGLSHKHLPEMTKICGLERTPVFIPVVGDFYAGIAAAIPLHNDLLNGSFTAEDIQRALAEYYKDEYFVKVAPFMGEGILDGGYLEANAEEGTNVLNIFVCGNEKQTVIVSRLDNLGKGASGAAVENMNIALGLDEKTGLI